MKYILGEAYLDFEYENEIPKSVKISGQIETDKEKNCVFNYNRVDEFVEFIKTYSNSKLIIYTSVVCEFHNLISSALGLEISTKNDGTGLAAVNDFVEFRNIGLICPDIDLDSFEGSIIELIHQREKMFNLPFYKIPWTLPKYILKEVEKSISKCKWIKKQIPDKELAIKLDAAFRGGFVSYNIEYRDKVVKNVVSFDVNSEYPYVLYTKKYPGEFRRIRIGKINNKKELYGYLHQNKKAVLAKIEIKNLQLKAKKIPYLVNKKVLISPESLIINDKIISAKNLIIYLTDIDLKLIEKVYNFSEIKVLELYEANYQYLPKTLIELIEKHYRNKTKLKHKKESNDYKLSKLFLNLIYGSVCRNPIKYGNTKLPFQWGVWCSAYGREKLFELIELVGNDFIYCDTDCVKFFESALNKKEVKNYIFNYNKVLEEVDNNGEVHNLGSWELDDYYNEFKTTGNKTYCVKVEDKIKITAAGGNADEMEQVIKNVKDFDESTFIPASRKQCILVHQPITLDTNEVLEHWHYYRIVTTKENESTGLVEGRFTQTYYLALLANK